MAWGRMDDKFHRNRKVRELRRSKGGKEALADWTFWWSWCLDDPELTGIVPLDELSGSDLKSAELLVKAGLWDRVEGGYKFHDFHEYNPTREKIAKKRDADRERIASKKPHSVETEPVSESHPIRTRVANDSQANDVRFAGDSPPRDAHARPNPSQPIPESESALAEISDRSLVWARLGKIYQEVYDAEQEGARNPRLYDEQRILSSDSKQFRKLVELVKTEAKRSGIGERQVFVAAAQAFLRDPRQREKGLVLEFFTRDFTLYVDRSDIEAAS